MTTSLSLSPRLELERVAVSVSRLALYASTSAYHPLGPRTVRIVNKQFILVKSSKFYKASRILIQVSLHFVWINS